MFFDGKSTPITKIRFVKRKGAQSKERLRRFFIVVLPIEGVNDKLMMNLHQDLQFESVWNTLGDSYNSSLIQNVSTKQGDGWLNLFTVTRFSKCDAEILESEVMEKQAKLARLGVEAVPGLALVYEVEKPDKHLSTLSQMKKGTFRLAEYQISLRDGYTKTSINTHDLIQNVSEDCEFLPVNYMFSADSVPALPSNIHRFMQTTLRMMNPIGQIFHDWFGTNELQGLNSITVCPVYLSKPTFRLSRGRLTATYSIHSRLQDKTTESTVLRASGRLLEKMTSQATSRVNPKTGLIMRSLRYARTDADIYGNQVEFVIQSEIGELLVEAIDGTSLMFPSSHLRNHPTSTLASTLEKLTPSESMIPKIEQGERFFGNSLSLDSDFVRFSLLTLSLLGLNTFETDKLSFAASKAADGSDLGDVDIMAYDTKMNRTFMFQCTLHSPDSGKLDRTRNVQERLRQIGIPVEIVFLVKTEAAHSKNNSGFRVVDKQDWLLIWEKLSHGDYEDAKAILLPQA